MYFVYFQNTVFVFKYIFPHSILYFNFKYISMYLCPYVCPVSSTGTPCSYESFRRPLLIPQSCVVIFMMDGCTCLGFKISIAIHCHYKAWKSQDIF